MLFSDLGLSKPILRAIKEQGYSTPTPIQQKAIPMVLKKHDILAGAQTGTGKTAGFTLPLLEKLSSKKAKLGKHQIRALILAPTRELAAQVGESVTNYSKYLPLKSTVIFGGVGINPQKAALRKGVDIVVATPGRLLDHIEQKTIDISQVECFILDEADRMLDMGFIRDIKKVLALLPKQKQSLLFSATFSKEIQHLADTLLNQPKLIEVAKRNTSSKMISQVVHHVDKGRKQELLSNLIKTGKWKQVLVFTRTKHGANKLSQNLERNGISATAIHGNKSQGARTKALADFKAGKVRVLVATDIAARGIDIDQLPHVVNYELPNVAEDYVHRIGRTGRAGNVGEAVSLVCVDEHEFLSGIEKLIKMKIKKVIIKGFEVDKSIKAEPINLGGRSSNRNANRNNNKNTKKDGDSQSKNQNQKRRKPKNPQRSDKDEKFDSKKAIEEYSKPKRKRFVNQEKKENQKNPSRKSQTDSKKENPYEMPKKKYYSKKSPKPPSFK